MKQGLICSFAFLEVDDLLAVGRVCRLWRSASLAPELWRRHAAAALEAEPDVPFPAWELLGAADACRSSVGSPRPAAMESDMLAQLVAAMVPTLRAKAAPGARRVASNAGGTGAVA